MQRAAHAIASPSTLFSCFFVFAFFFFSLRKTNAFLFYFFFFGRLNKHGPQWCLQLVRWRVVIVGILRSFVF